MVWLRRPQTGGIAMLLIKPTEMKKLYTLLAVLCLCVNSKASKTKGFYAPECQVNVINSTAYDLDGLVLWACHYLHIHDVFIRIEYLPDNYVEEGLVRKIYDKIYYIYLKKGLLNLNLVVMHELVHVKQYESGDLNILSASVVTYKNKTIDLNRIHYRDRSYEHEAHAKGRQVWRDYQKHRRELRHQQEVL